MKNLPDRQTVTAPRARPLFVSAVGAGAAALAAAASLALVGAACSGVELKPLPGGAPPEYEESRGYDAGAAGRPAQAGPGDGVYNNVTAPVPTGPPGDAPRPGP